MTATTFIGHFLGPDTHANRPSATGLPNGTLYVCTTHNKIERTVSGAWADYATLGGGAWALLSTTTLASPGTIDVSGISGAYNDLHLVLIARDTAGGGDNNTTVKFNNDGAGNYYMQRIRGQGSTVDASPAMGSAGFQQTVLPGTPSIANGFGYQAWTIVGYAATTWIKTFFCEVSTPVSTTQIVHGVYAGFWNSTAAINRVTISGAIGNLATGSQLRIYGRT